MVIKPPEALLRTIAHRGDAGAGSVDSSLFGSPRWLVRAVPGWVSRESEQGAPHPLASRPRVRAVALIMCGSLLSGLAAAASAPFESVPDQSPSSLLPASLAAGSDFHVLDPVRGDGLMHLFVTD